MGVGHGGRRYLQIEKQKGCFVFLPVIAFPTSVKAQENVFSSLLPGFFLGFPFSF